MRTAAFPKYAGIVKVLQDRELLDGPELIHG
jgi:hypothetical protein